MRVPGRVLRRNVVLWDDGKRLRLHPRGQEGRWEDGGMTGGQQDGRRTAGWREDSRTAGGQRDGGRTAGRWATTPQLYWVHTGDSGMRGRERMMLLTKCTRRCVREEEGSGEKASIYIILALTLAPHAPPPATPLRTTITLFPTKAELPRGSYLLCLTIMPHFLQGDRVCMGTADGTHLLLVVRSPPPHAASQDLHTPSTSPSILASCFFRTA